MSVKCFPADLNLTAAAVLDTLEALFIGRGLSAAMRGLGGLWVRVSPRARRLCAAGRGASLLETVVVLGLVMIAMELAFGALSGYVTLHRRSLAESSATVEGFNLRNLLISRVDDGVRGLGLRGEGGTTPLGRVGDQVVGAVWVHADGRKLGFVERVKGASPAPVLYAARAGSRLRLIVAGARGWSSSAPPFVAVLGLEAPEGWPSASNPPPAVGEPFRSPRYGYLARVTGCRAAEAADVPDTEPEAERLRRAMALGAAVWLELEPGPVGEVSLPLAAEDILASAGRRHVTRAATCQVTPVADVVEMTCEPTGALTLRGLVGGVEELLPPGSLAAGAVFRYVSPDLREQTGPLRLREHFGLSFSGRLTSPTGGPTTPVYLPLAPVEWQPL